MEYTALRGTFIPQWKMQCIISFYIDTKLNFWSSQFIGSETMIKYFLVLLILEKASIALQGRYAEAFLGRFNNGRNHTLVKTKS